MADPPLDLLVYLAQNGLGYIGGSTVLWLFIVIGGVIVMIVSGLIGFLCGLIGGFLASQWVAARDA